MSELTTHSASGAVLAGCWLFPTLSASACGRGKRRRFGCRRAAKLRALTCGSCLTGAPWRGGSFAARRRLLGAQVAAIDPLCGAVGDAGCGHASLLTFLPCSKKVSRPPGRDPRPAAACRKPNASYINKLREAASKKQAELWPLSSEKVQNKERPRRRSLSVQQGKLIERLALRRQRFPRGGCGRGRRRCRWWQSAGANPCLAPGCASHSRRGR